MTWRGGLVLASVIAVGGAHASTLARAAADQQPAAVAYFVRNLDNPRERREARADILDTPVLPGSIVKAVTLVTALEDGVIQADSDYMCRRSVTVDGQKYVCAHPDLKRALSPAEALAYSCNDFFVSLASRLSRGSLNKTRVAAGLAPIAGDTPMSAALVGLAGPRISPRALVDVLSRLAGAGKDKPVPMSATTRAVLIEGLRGAAEYGTASAFKAGGVSALAKTGTILMPSGAALGLVVALTPAERPTHGVVVAAPGGAGVDAAAIAADVLSQRAPASLPSSTPAPQHLSTSALQPIRLGRALPSGNTRIETIPVDTYIAQVLAGEGQPRAGDAAQQALAITARTFAIANRNRHRREGFDLCDTTHCQVVRAATPTTTRAALATSGRMLLHQGQPAFVFYSASCGGRTESASEVWPGAIDYTGAASVHDEADEGEPSWESDVRVQDVERALRAAGLRGERLRDIRVVARNKSNRVSRIRVDGFTPAEIGGHEFRMAVGRVAGFQAIKSTAFDINRTGSGYHFRGRGFGHGVGLCVIGAGQRASRGATADDILKFYYPGLTVGAGATGLLTTTTLPAAPAAPAARDARDAPVAPVAPAAPEILLALPGSEEAERGALLTLVRRSRDEVVKATGAIPPARLRITVHPTVDSFGRTTGQPWWVSGATEGAAIDLLPLTTLRQQGQLERTVRHEVVHALLDGALSSRPMWVREGAAAYFASPPGSRPQPARVTCPKDAELLRPVSAGAQREAYTRAEACFARAMADGKRWDQIR